MHASRAMSLTTALAGLVAAATMTAAGRAADEAPAPALPDTWVNALQWRSVGPANMGGRITDLAVYEADPCIWWAATASGGLLKTVNNGISFAHQFDHEATVSIGSVDVAQSDPNIVWVGTGESNPRNSVSWGDGVYKSTDGGETWKNMGLRESFQVGRILIHPENPDIVYVGALGRLWGPNEERGLYKTTDGGETWEQVLYVDDKTGVVDLRMHPEDPDTLLVAAYERERDGFDTNDPAKRWGPGSGLYRTTDGGETFKKITKGLPECSLGRIGLDWYRGDPDIVYALVESERIGKEPENAAYMGIRGEDADVGSRLTEVTEDGPAAEAGLQNGDIVIRVDDDVVQSYQDLLRQVRRRLAGDTVEIEVSRNRKSVTLEMTFAKRPGSEEDEETEEERPQRRRQRGPFQGSLGGQRENMQDQQGDDGHEYGGLYRSTDGGRSWERINSVNPRPMYFSQIRVDPSDENYIYVLGVSLYRSSDGGETFTGDGGRGGVHVDHHAMWVDPNDGRHIILGNDGGLYVTLDRMEGWDHLNHMAIGQFYHVTVDSRENYRIYGGLQDNGSWGGPSRSRSGSGPINEDWFRIGGGDGFVCLVDREDPDQLYMESQNGAIGRMNLRTGDRAFMRPRAPRGTRYRFNWKTPFVLSNHNSRIYYTAGNYVFRSFDRGRELESISPEITKTDRGSATALAESPLNPNVLYVGTDDGALWMTRNGGHEWIDLFDPPAETAKTAATGATAPSEGGRRGARTGGPGGRGERGGRGGGGRGGRMLEMLLAADADGDGRITEDEVPERMARMFDRVDENGDGAIDKKEIAALAERMGVEIPAPKKPAAGEYGTKETSEADPDPEADSEAEPQEEPDDPETTDAPGAASDPITGTWTGKAFSEQMPAGQGDFTLVLKLEPEDKVTGRLRSQFNDGDIVPGKLDRKSGRLAFEFEAEAFALTFEAKVDEGRMTGTMSAGDMFSMDFEAKRTSTTSEDEPAEQVAEDDGYDWKPLKELVPEPRWVSSVETSRFKAGRVYVTFDGHKSNDDAPYAFVSENYGRTWRTVIECLPETVGSMKILREDITNENILYAGTEFSAWVSIDRGATWTSLNTNLPTVAVHEIAQHPTVNEIVAGTHGRSVWILDVAPLRQMTTEVVSNGVNLFKPKPANYWRSLPSRGGDLRRFVGENAPTGAWVYYSLNRDPGYVALKVTDAAGKTIRTLEPPATEGLHRVGWDLRGDPPRARQGQAGRGGRGGQGGRFRRGGPRVAPGNYKVVLTVDDTDYVQTLNVQGDPEYRDVVLWGEAYDEMLDLMEQMEAGDEDGPEADDSEIIH